MPVAKEQIRQIIADNNISSVADKMGCAIAQLHRAFMQCESEMEFWDNSLLNEMKGWVRETLINNEWQIIDQEEYSKAVETLDAVYDYLPKQLIHRDVHFGNFLFFEDNFSGYIDFEGPKPPGSAAPPWLLTTHACASLALD